MALISGFLGLCSAVGTGTATEITAAGYRRQPIAFGDAASGTCFSAVPYTFGQALRGPFAGRAIYDAPTAGNLLFVLPHPSPVAAARLPWDAGPQGHLRLTLDALASYPRSDSYSGTIAAATVIGTTSDAFDVVSLHDQSQTQGQELPNITTAPLSSGVALVIARGLLMASSTWSAL